MKRPESHLRIVNPMGVRAFVSFVFVAAISLLGTEALAGPPFATDDPEPTGYRQWEIYLAGLYSNDGATVSGTLPQLEINYGPLPNVQIAGSFNCGLTGVPEHATHVGWGDNEFGLKLRFVQENSTRPQVAFYPSVTLAGNNQASHDAYVRTFLPVWLQKTWGQWTVYGGTGRWINPGAGNLNWWFSGLTVEREVSDRLVVGGEIFHGTPDTVGASSTTGFNIGMIAAARGPHRILFSIGRALHGTNSLSAYGAYKFELGPQPSASPPTSQTQR